MLLLLGISLTAGYFLNEESSLWRITKSLGYVHEGWLILNTKMGLLIFFLFCIKAFLKAYFYAIILQSIMPLRWYLPVSMYILANIIAVIKIKGTGYSPWLAFAGFLCAGCPEVFHAGLTVLVVIFLFTRDYSKSFLIWRMSLLVFCLFLTPFPLNIYLFLICTVCSVLKQKTENLMG